MVIDNQVTWVILAGGQASRMGKKDKGLLLYRGTPLIQYVLEALRPQASHIWICANRNLSAYQQLAPVIQDVFSGFMGPLAGLHAALTHTETEWVGILPCDGPHVSTAFVSRFYKATQHVSKAYVAHDGQSLQPVYALVHRSILSELTQYLEQGERKVALFYDKVGALHVDCHDIQSMFTNINTPEQLTTPQTEIN